MRRSHMLVVGAIAVTALSACGSPEKPRAEAKVATLASTAATPSSSAAVKAQRPRERLDTTPEEAEAMLGPYNKCMAEHGGFVKGQSGRPGRLRPATKQEIDKASAADQICGPQFLPLPPWEKDPANPEAKDFARAVVKCLKAKGVKFVEVSDDGISVAFGGDQNDARSISMGLDLAPACERQVAAETK